MHSDERRKAIADVLRAADAPVSASALAEKFSVSRQIIVGDIALLRSSGEEILATPRGYVTPKEAHGILRRVAVKHTPQEMEAELNAIVDKRLYGHRRHRRPPHLRPAHRSAANFEPLRGQPVH